MSGIHQKVQAHQVTMTEKSITHSCENFTTDRGAMTSIPQKNQFNWIRENRAINLLKKL